MAVWVKKALKYRLLALGCLTLLAMATLKYSSTWNCDYTDLGVDTRHLGNEYCKDQLYRALKLPPQNRINCSQIIKGDRSALEEASLRSLEAKRVPLTETQYLHMTKDCSDFKNERRFIQFPLSKEEENFPIAYSMVIHQKIENFERLLRAIYAPQNVYCVHIDEKSPEPFKEAVRAITSCFPNVFVATKLVAVVYASWSRVQADLNCMEDLLRSPVPWKYLLNTCGTDFPIKTNAEMVRSLKVLNGKNSMESEVPSAYKRSRWKHRYMVAKNTLFQMKMEKGPPPDNVPMFTGNAYFVACRSFVQHLFENPRARKLIEWTNDTYSPDEHLWATLQRVPWMPGSIPHHSKYHTSDLNAIARLVKWMGHEGDVGKGAPYAPCTGTHQRAVCIYGAGDLHWMLQNHHLLANKFDPQVDDNALQCLEEYLRHKAVYGRAL